MDELKFLPGETVASELRPTLNRRPSKKPPVNGGFEKKRSG